ncbi:hypothetical protein [Schaalia odontolytica]|uniref:Uncharacterized protein n=2 Tax=Schaalia odontolytica TaxID=1660 RepID=A0A857AAN7_9ACTO|nr:hypothetical protein [Schaalia odontolytica]EFF80930.1 hypothetical protein HMPREF0970_00110 [Schaalia odontolytica F0309]QGS11586.1 hypothetical protein FOC40_09340 [Schaalia odontolytica]
MTTSNDDQTTQLPEWDETTPLPTASTTTSGQDATAEMPASSPDLTSDPLAIFREASTTQMPADPFRADAGTESQAGTSGAQGSQAQAGAPAGSVGTGGRTAFDPASTGESTPRGDEAGAAPGTQARAGATPAPGTQTWSAQHTLGTTYPLPEAPSRGVRVGSFVWALLVCMVGAFLIAEVYITNLNLPVLGISAVALLGIILIFTALFSSRTKKNPKQGAGPQAAPNPADAIRRG